MLLYHVTVVVMLASAYGWSNFGGVYRAGLIRVILRMKLYRLLLIRDLSTPLIVVLQIMVPFLSTLLLLAALSGESFTWSSHDIVLHVHACIYMYMHTHVHVCVVFLANCCIKTFSCQAFTFVHILYIVQWNLSIRHVLISYSIDVLTFYVWSQPLVTVPIERDSSSVTLLLIIVNSIQNYWKNRCLRTPVICMYMYTWLWFL